MSKLDLVTLLMLPVMAGLIVAALLTGDAILVALAVAAIAVYVVIDRRAVASR